MRGVQAAGYAEPTPIQLRAIPVVLGGGDLIGSAQTGTGKTASFSLPIIQLLLANANSSASPARHPVRALVLVSPGMRDGALLDHLAALTIPVLLLAGSGCAAAAPMPMAKAITGAIH